MPSIAIGLPECGFLEDLPDVTFTGITAAAYATVKLDGLTLLSDIRLTPDEQSRIVIYSRQMIRGLVSLAKPAAFETPLSALLVELRIESTTLATSGFVIPGGTSKAETVNKPWYAKNFLTWQPQIVETSPVQPQWLAFVPLSGYGNYTIKSTLYVGNGKTFSKEVCVVIPGSRYVQIDTSFAALWREFCLEKEAVPFCYDVYGSVTIREEAADEGIDGEAVTYDDRPYAQRYQVRPERSDDICFGFVNTLGGFDTLMMQGKVVLKPEGDIGTFVNGEVETEISNAYTSYWETSSGYIDSERMAAQYQDFLKSRDRWVYRDGQWRRIIVDEYKVEHAARELNAYTFKYHLAERNERHFYERAELPEPQIVPGEFFPERR